MNADENHVVFQFADGAIYLAFDADADEATNSKHARVLAAEGRRRLKAGRTDAGVLRLRKIEDVFVDPQPTSTTAANV